MPVFITVPVNGFSGVWRCTRVSVYVCVLVEESVGGKKLVKHPTFLSPPPPLWSQSVLPVRRWWWRPGSSMTSGVSQAVWWGALGWCESWMAVRYYWCQCGRGSALDFAVYCFPLCWMCWMQGFHVSCTTKTTWHAVFLLRKLSYINWVCLKKKNILETHWNTFDTILKQTSNAEGKKDDRLLTKLSRY